MINLTGITPTGNLHLGNYIGSIKPALDFIHLPANEHHQLFVLIADYHALIKCKQPEIISQSIVNIAATFMACSRYENIVIYRQSDIPEIMELNWILNCLSAKGLMNRAHAYKAMVQQNELNNDDCDFNVNMGLFSYPILMTADILILNADSVFVGKDQFQHINIARDIAEKFNSTYKTNYFKYPNGIICENSLKGFDGRKMSKSYGNTIPLFSTEKELKKLINKIVTNSKLPNEPKFEHESSIFDFYKAFSGYDDYQNFKQEMVAGKISWGDSKKMLFNLINESICQQRDNYYEIIKKTNDIKDRLNFDAKYIRNITNERLKKIKDIIF